MGSGIAQVAAQAGLAVHLADVDEAALRKGLDTIEKNLSRGGRPPRTAHPGGGSRGRPRGVRDRPGDSDRSTVDPEVARRTFGPIEESCPDLVHPSTAGRARKFVSSSARSQWRPGRAWRP